MYYSGCLFHLILLRHVSIHTEIHKYRVVRALNTKPADVDFILYS